MSLVQHFGSVPKMLQRLVPGYIREFQRFPRLKTQRLLSEMVKVLFPGHPILLGFRYAHLRFLDTGKLMELDMFIPTLALAFEYLQDVVYSVASGLTVAYGI